MIRFIQTGHQVVPTLDKNDDLVMVEFSAEPPVPGAKVQFTEWPKGRTGWATVTWVVES